MKIKVCGLVVTETYSFGCGWLGSYEMSPGDRSLTRTPFLREGFQRSILWLVKGCGEDGSGIRAFIKSKKYFH